MSHIGPSIDVHKINNNSITHASGNSILDMIVVDHEQDPRIGSASICSNNGSQIPENFDDEFLHVWTEFMQGG